MIGGDRGRFTSFFATQCQDLWCVEIRVFSAVFFLAWVDHGLERDRVKCYQII